MDGKAILYTNAGGLRAPWRVVVFVLVSLATLTVAEFTVGPVIAFIFPSIGMFGVTNEEWVWMIGLLASTYICIRRIDRRPADDVWLNDEAARPRVLIFGFGVGALAIGIPVVLLIAIGWLHKESWIPGSWWGAALRVTFVLGPAALFEELLTRGYILSALVEAWGWTWAVVATSVGFGLLHLTNPGVKPQDVALVTLAGFFLAGVLYVTKSLYAAWMAHFAWNWTMAVVFHTAVSGLAVDRPNYRYVDAGPDWATGGEWGPEGGVPAAAGMAIGMVLMFGARRRIAGLTYGGGPSRTESNETTETPET